MLWVAADNEEVVKTATPLAFNVTGAYSAVVPSRKVTVPLGTGGGGFPGCPATVAVKVTGWALIPGLTDEVNPMVGVLWASPGIAKHISTVRKTRHQMFLICRILLHMNSLVFLVYALEICNRMIALKMPDARSHFIN